MQYFEKISRRQALAMVGAAGLAGWTGSASAADWKPTRPVELLISFPPGGTADALGRFVAHRLGEKTKAVVVVSNRPGGGGVIMHRALQAAKQDGHTIGLCASYELTYSSQERGASPYGIDDFTYLAGLARSPHCLVAKPGVGLDTIEQIRAYALKKGSLSVGVAAPFDWLAERLGEDLGINAIGVPFKGGAEMMQQVMAGHLDLTWSAGSHAPLEKAGTLKVVIALTQDRLPGNPDVPTLRERGGKLVVESRFLIVGPKTLSAPAAAALTAALADVMADPAMQADVSNRGLVPAYLDGAQLRQSMHAEAVQAKAIEAAALRKS